MHADGLAGIGGYRIERPLGEGGMGRVFLCRDTALDRPVAIKVLQPELLAQEEMRARFLREARALARVSSPHVVAVHAVGEDEAAGPFVVMEYLDGEDLHVRLVRDKQIPWRDAVAAVKDAVAGLRAAEGAGIVHRDIKPANLFVVGGKAKLTDFGLAREVKGAAGVTQAGIVVGTPAYLAPEVIKGSPASHMSDLYSLGATLFHLVAGRPPFTAEAPLEVIAQAVSDTPPALSSLVDVPPALSDLVARMIAKDPARRPQGFAALEADLGALVEATMSPVPQRTMLFSSAASGELPASGGAPAAPEPPSSTATGATGALFSVPSVSDLPTMDVPMPPSPLPVAPAATASTPLRPPAAEISTSGPVPRIKTASLTVMITDIVGYSERTSRVSREESARWLALHDQLLQPVFRSFSGKVVKTLGDAFLVTFPSPTDAVHCACAIQDRLFLHNQGARAEDAIHVRVALSAGEVRLHKGDVFGEPVNLASRIEALAEPGEVLVSDAVYATMAAAEVKLQSRGEHALKGIARPVVVYAAVPDGVDGKPPFGGRALARVKESVVDGIVAGAPIAMQRAQAAAEPVLDAARRVLGGRRGAVVTATAAAILLIAVLLGVLLRDTRISRIDRGEAKTVIEELDKIPDAQKSGKDFAVLGHARLALDQKERAFDAYKKAVDKKVTDDRMERALLQALAKRDDDGAKEVLVAWPDPGIDGELRTLLKSDDWWPRHHAYAILDDRKALKDDEKQDVALHDLASDSCADRRAGVQLLKKSGKGDDAVDALEKLRADPLKNACLVFELQSAIDAVKKRSAAK